MNKNYDIFFLGEFMNYYDECLNKIENLLKEGNNKEALDIIDEELSMIYIPKEFEEKLISYKNNLVESKSIKYLSDEEIESYLSKDEYYQLLAIKELEKRNIRQYIDLVQDIFENTESILVKISLLEICIQQQITDEIKFVKDGLEIYFIPASCNLPEDSDGYETCLNYLKEWFENEDPSFYKLCQHAALKEAYLHLPFEIEMDEAEAMAYAIVMYVSELMGCKESVKKTLYEKNTSQIDDFELLLYSNTI